MKRLALALVAALLTAGCFGGSGTGTRDNPIKYRKPGQSCSTVSGFAETKQGDLLLCARDEGSAAPRWILY